jgi:hypothetical protein
MKEWNLASTTTSPLVVFPGRLQITDANGAPCPGAQLYISGEVAGSRGDAREPMALFADAAHKIPLPNPVVADAEGLLPLVYLASLSFDCMASTDNRILWSYFDCKGFAYAGGNFAKRAAPIVKAPLTAGTITALTFDRTRNLLTLNLADQQGAPLAELQLATASAKDLRRLLDALIDEPPLGGSIFSPGKIGEAELSRPR